MSGLPIKHGRRLRKGEPLSLLLFVLAIDPLQQILELSPHHVLLHKIRGGGTVLCTSIYMDNAVVFIAPHEEDVRNFSTILLGLEKSLGLQYIYKKSWSSPFGATTSTFMMCSWACR
jgi:hypothetical protein